MNWILGWHVSGEWCRGRKSETTIEHLVRDKRYTKTVFYIYRSCIEKLSGGPLGHNDPWN